MEAKVEPAEAVVVAPEVVEAKTETNGEQNVVEEDKPAEETSAEPKTNGTTKADQDLDNSCKLFVGRLPHGTKPEQLIELFGKYGEVVHCDIVGKYGFVVCSRAFGLV